MMHPEHGIYFMLNDDTMCTAKGCFNITAGDYPYKMKQLFDEPKKHAKPRELEGHICNTIWCKGNMSDICCDVKLSNAATCLCSGLDNSTASCVCNPLSFKKIE